MGDWKGWLKLAASWVASVCGFLTEHVTVGKVALWLTIFLTALQIWKTWLDIQHKRRQRRRHHDY